MLLDVATIIARAHDLRKRADLTEPPYSTRALLEVAFPSALVTGERLPRGVHEMVGNTKNGPLIVYERKISTPQQRVAIAHAVGHLSFDFDSIDAINCQGDTLAVRERRADVFAAEVLVPLHDLDNYVASPVRPRDPTGRRIYDDMVDEVAAHFQVPQSLIHRRVGDLRLFRRTSYYLE